MNKTRTISYIDEAGDIVQKDPQGVAIIFKTAAQKINVPSVNRPLARDSFNATEAIAHKPKLDDASESLTEPVFIKGDQRDTIVMPANISTQAARTAFSRRPGESMVEALLLRPFEF